METTILTRIKDEHDEIRGCMEVILSSPPADREELYHGLKRILVYHMHSEEESIYKRLKTDVHTEAARALAKSSEQDHHLIKEYLQCLNFLRSDSEDWLALFKKLFSETERHCREEERTLFAEAWDDFSKRELVEMGRSFIESRSEIQLQ